MKSNSYKVAGLATVLVVVAAACSLGDASRDGTGDGFLARVLGQQGQSSPALPALTPGQVLKAMAPHPARTSRSPGQSFASLPDRGDLVAYPESRVARRAGPYTWHRADISEAHALGAIAGVLTITSPSGQLLRFAYDRHVEHASGDWTWIGHAVGGTAADDAILTFGAGAVFGTIAQAGTAPLMLAMEDGTSWLVETDRDALTEQNRATGRHDQPDFLLPPDLPVVESIKVQAAGVRSSESTASTSTTVDVLIGYTTGFENAHKILTDLSPVLSRLNFLVDVANESYVNSQVAVRVRLVHAMKVSYQDSNGNSDALRALTGSDGESDVNYALIDTALKPLHAARDQYGADLVVLVRDFQHPEAVSCGVAWLLGGEQRAVDGRYAPYGMAVVSDGSDDKYFCEDTTFAHELGHSLGLAHDRDTAMGDNGVLDPDEYGRYPYSFGYRTALSQGDFYTVMAYSDEQKNGYRIFSNPDITACGGFPCGVEDHADSARALRQTAPIIAEFRATVVADDVVPNPVAPDLYTIARDGSSGRTEVHVLGGAGSYQSFTNHYATALHQTGSDASWAFLVGDYNKDGVQDIYSISKLGGSGRTEVHVLDGASGFSRFSAHIATALHGTGNDNGWQFKLGDFNRDGTLDLYSINRDGGSGRTEVHVLDGASNFQSFLAHVGTGLHSTGTGYQWVFEVGDYNRDGFADIFVILKSGGSGTTEVHVLDGANRFQSFLLHRATALHQTPADNAWEFKLGDYDQDGWLDVYAVSKNGGSGRTELHVLGGASGYTSFIAHRATALHNTGADESWEFEIGPGP